MLLIVFALPLVSLGVFGLLDAAGLTRWVSALQRLRSFFASPLLEALLLLAGIALIVAGVYGLNRSMLSAFRRRGEGEVVDVIMRHRQRQRGPRVVAIGGGHGLNTLLRGLKQHTDNITAIVTVADDGGSSGRLRRDLGILPPGDFRNCLAALSDAEGLMTQLFQYRFGDDSDLEGHNFGNLYLTAMAAITGSFESALNESSRVLAVRGRVLPSTLAQVVLCAEVFVPAPAIAGDGEQAGEGSWRQVCGESKIGTLGGRIHRVYLDPENALAYPESIRAILEADLVVAGPGSLYTSVLPNLLVSDIAEAIAASPAQRVYVCNLATQVGETDGYDVNDHVRALRQHVGPELFPTVIANHTFRDDRPPGGGADFVRLPPPAEQADYQLLTYDLADDDFPWRHDPDKLAGILMELVNA